MSLVGEDVDDLIVTFSVAALRGFCDPFASLCWRGLDMPISPREVRDAIEEGDLLSPDAGPSASFERDDHVARVAWFVVNGWHDPIGVDVGVPGLGCMPRWPVIDGNHRLGAAIYRKDREIVGTLSGAFESDFARNLLAFGQGLPISTRKLS